MKWIKVSTRKPNYYFDCLVVDIDNNITVGFLDTNNKWSDKDVYLDNITHWMPFPLPPKH